MKHVNNCYDLSIVFIHALELVDDLDLLLNGNWKHGSIPELWDGKTGSRIVTHLTQILRQRN